MIYVLHSSKTMRYTEHEQQPNQQPIFLHKAQELQKYLKHLNTTQISHLMHVSEKLAVDIAKTIARWNTNDDDQSIAIDSFKGDIFSGLQAASLSSKDRAYANKHLVFLSGLYGLIRPLDGIMPYRLEMGYSLQGFTSPTLYIFWGSLIANAIRDETILNLSSVEYAKVLTKYIPDHQIYSPRFLTLDKKTNSYKNIAVHAKIARGSFARWAIINRVDDPKMLINYNDLGYEYNKALSSEHCPVFTCEAFQGLGLSVRKKTNYI